MAAMIFLPRLLPASIRWSEGVSLVQVILGIVVLVLSIKCLVLLIREGSTLSAAQRSAAWLGLTSLFLGAITALVFFWIAGTFNAKK